MPQDRESGAAGNEFGRTTAPRIAKAIGARDVGSTGNEFQLDAKLVAIKCARPKTSSVGVTYKMLDRVESILGAFMGDDGVFDVYEISSDDFKAHMRPSRSQGASAGKVALVARNTFFKRGKRVARVRLPDTPVEKVD